MCRRRLFPEWRGKSETLDQGWHLVGLFDKVTRYPVRMQTVNNQDIQVATSDGKTSQWTLPTTMSFSLIKS
ncbi:SPFH domain-containing protein [Bacillus licheniformis]|nr:SPFH domain-containing protein [Bacillus licheniformis]